MTAEEAKRDALEKHPDCRHAEVFNGLSWDWRMTWVVKLWRTEECWLADDPPRYTVEGYSARTTSLDEEAKARP